MREPKVRNGVSYLEAARRGGAISAAKKQKRVDKYNLNPSLCKLCKTSISYEKRKNKFCNHSCSASFNNLGIVRNFTTGLWQQKSCLYCGELTSSKKYCNYDCCKKYHKQKKRDKIKQLESLVDYKKDKWYLIEIRSHACEICNCSIWNKEDIPLDIHHKDGNSDNNKFDNLLLICPNCHRQTKNHGSKNKKNGISKRKQYRKNRYDQGLSY